jgi:hypothetical protein
MGIVAHCVSMEMGLRFAPRVALLMALTAVSVGKGNVMKDRQRNDLARWWTGTAAGLVLGLAGAAHAEPVTYRGTVVTDVKLGTQSFHNAALKLTFSGDTADIAEVTDPSGNPIPSACDTTPHTPIFFWLTKGSAAFSFEIGGKKYSGNFLPGQVFVSDDSCSGGIGFGMVTPQGFEPIYPLSFTHGSAQTHAYAVANPLSTAGNTTGNAWSCIGFNTDFESFTCTPPETLPLHSDAGDLLVYMPYQFLCGDGTNEICLPKSGSMNRGTFSVVPGISH